MVERGLVGLSKAGGEGGLRGAVKSLGHGELGRRIVAGTGVAVFVVLLGNLMAGRAFLCILAAVGTLALRGG